MRRATALRAAETIAARVKAHGGLIGTPHADYEAVRIKRVWLFGSTAKGSEAPNDVDILLEYIRCGRHQLCGKWRRYRASNAKLAKRYYRSTGIKTAICAANEALRHLRGALKMVRFHSFDVDGDLAHPRILLYPRNDLSPTSTIRQSPQRKRRSSADLGSCR